VPARPTSCWVEPLHTLITTRDFTRDHKITNQKILFFAATSPGFAGTSIALHVGGGNDESYGNHLMTKTKTDLPTRGSKLRATTLLHKLGQSLWLDNITRDLLDQGTLKRYINEFSVLQATRLIQNPAFLASGAFAAPKHNSDFEYIFSPDAVTFSFRSERMKCCAHSVVGPGFKRPYDQFFAGMKECGTGTRIRPRRKSSNSRP